MRDMKKEIKGLLDWLCVEWGFCIPPKSAKKIIESEALEADKFAHAVLEAEGIDPNCDINWVRKISRKFIDKFGCREISQSDFKNSLM